MNSPGTSAPQPREPQHCACGELLTFDTEFDFGVCVECRRQAFEEAEYERLEERKHA